MSSGEDEALLVAISAGDAERVATLLAQHASPRACSKNDWSALHLAAHAGFTKVGELLLDAGAEIDELMFTEELVDRTRYEGSATPLLIAIRARNESFALMLLTRGANAQLTDPASGEHALLLAARYGFESVVERVLAQGPVVECQSFQQDTPIDAAARGGYIGIVRRLLAAGQRANEGSLVEACACGHIEIASLLVEAGAVVNVASDRCPLRAAARSGQIAMMEWLLSKGADLSSQGASALNDAASSGKMEAVVLLLERGVDVNARDGFAWTPLMQTAWHGHREMSQALLDAGADPTLKDSTGKTALDWARQSHRRDAVGTLEAWKK